MDRNGNRVLRHPKPWILVFLLGGFVDDVVHEVELFLVVIVAVHELLMERVAAAERRVDRESTTSTCTPAIRAVGVGAVRILCRSTCTSQKK